MKLLTLTAAFMAVGMMACSSSPKTENPTTLEQQVAAEPKADTPEQIAQRASEAFGNAPGLSVDQKKKLMEIYANTYTNSMAIRTEIGQSKSLLFKMLGSAGYQSNDVTVLKKKITSLDEKRLALMFQALEDVQKVVGVGEGKEEIYRHLRDFEMPQTNHPIAK